MYDLAASLYPYENVHGAKTNSESEQRAQQQRFVDEAPENIIKQGSALPLLFVYMMSRGAASGPFDLAPIFKRPARAFGWLLLGNSILMAWRL